MAATVRITCERCGDVELPAAEATLTISGPTEGTPTHVTFGCPRCATSQSQPVNERGTLLLLRAGVGVTTAASPVTSDALPSHFDESR
jgi:hypothetical protein